MSEATGSVFCDRCGERIKDLPTDAPCPECGSRSRKTLTGDGSVLLSTWISAPAVRKHPVWAAVYALAGIGSVVGSFIALNPIASAGVAALFLVVGHVASERWEVRERDADRF